MNHSALKTVIIDQESISKDRRWIEREQFEDILNSHCEPFISIISGVRRCGKSTVLFQLKDKHDGYYLNFDDDRLVAFTVEDFQRINEIFHELYGTKQVYFFDEIQNIEGWERFVRRLHQSNKKVYVTGSNARLLSKELGTHLTGRYIEFQLYPFSFSEYLDFKKIPFDSKDFYRTQGKAKLIRAFHEYFQLGGMPEYLQTNNKNYIKSLYESILYRDVLVRYRITNEKTMKELMLFIFSNLCKPISFNKLKNLLGIKSATTIKEYFGYLENNYFVFLLSKFSFSVKKNIYANKKIYIIDNCFASILGFRSSGDRGRFLENIVYIELARHGKEVFYYQEKNECDFIVRKGSKIQHAIQVCYELNENNTKREFSGLIEAMHAFNLKTGFILTYDHEDEVLVEDFTIKILPVWKFCHNSRDTALSYIA